MRKLFTVLLCALMLIAAYPPLLAEAAGTKETPVAAAKDTAIGTEVFEGFDVTILDKTTTAADMRGRLNDPDWMCFISADGREVGVISYSEYLTIIEKNKKMVFFPNGSSLAAPPDGRESWNEWFADEFNKLRGLGAGSREEAASAEIADTIEEYRQEVIRLVNAEREKEGLPALTVNEEAMDYAQVRAQEISTDFSHTRPNGLEQPYDEIGSMGENIATHINPTEVMKGWMKSPGHRANILGDGALSIGVGCYRLGKGYFWVQEFVW